MYNARKLGGGLYPTGYILWKMKQIGLDALFGKWVLV